MNFDGTMDTKQVIDKNPNFTETLLDEVISACNIEATSKSTKTDDNNSSSYRKEYVCLFAKCLQSHQFWTHML